MSKLPGRSETSVSAMYGAEDLGSYPMFQGGFINFGYWDDIPKNISIDNRIAASRRLYEEVLNRLQITPTDELLEVGCGRGNGCCLALDQYHANNVMGLDATSEQIARCRAVHASRLSEGNLQFIEGLADQLPFSESSFDKIYSVEAAQHFPSLQGFLQEVLRVLKPGGRLALTTFFLQDGAPLAKIATMIPTVPMQIDILYPIHETVRHMQDIGFANVVLHSIGDHVWQGINDWLVTINHDGWGKNWLTVAQNGWIDYYIIEAMKP